MKNNIMLGTIIITVLMLMIPSIQAIEYLRNIGIEVSIVAELKRTLGPISKDVVMEFLRYQNIMQYFDELITPQGKINIRSGTVDPKYIGKSKDKEDYYNYCNTNYDFQ